MSTAIATTPAEPKPIRTRERMDHKQLAEVKAYAHSRLGQPNEAPIEGHPAGTLKVKTAMADGGPERWRIFFEWERVDAL